MARGSAPGERRGGRKAGTPNRGTVLVRERLDEEGAEPALELVKIARAAEKANDLSLAADCWGKLVAFVHPKPRPVEVAPDAYVELERRLTRAKLEEASKAVKDNPLLVGLADRLLRATDRDAALMPSAAPFQSASAPEASPSAGPTSETAASATRGAADDMPPTGPGSDAIIAAKPPAYRPVLWPDSSNDVEVDYDPTGGAYDFKR